MAVDSVGPERNDDLRADRSDFADDLPGDVGKVHVADTSIGQAKKRRRRQAKRVAGAGKLGGSCSPEVVHGGDVRTQVHACTPRGCAEDVHAGSFRRKSRECAAAAV